MQKIILLLCVIITSSCVRSWDYDGRNGPKHWGEVSETFKFCKIGYNQSPIDIVGSFDKQDLTLSYGSSQVDKIVQNHVVEFTFFNREFIKRGRKEYFIRQFHFHHPSEHAIKGKPYGLEMQIFHKSDDEQWLVLALFITLGEENQHFKQIIDLLESDKTEGEIDLSKIINQKDLMFFYDGSLTRPPCTESVKWYVMKTPLEISKEQMNKIIRLGIEVPSNARPLQVFHPDHY